MLRISIAEQTKESVRLAVEGSLTNRWVSELRKLSDAALEQGKTLELDLANLRYIDQEGCLLLRELAAQKVNHVNCSAFVQHYLEGIL